MFSRNYEKYIQGEVKLEIASAAVLAAQAPQSGPDIGT